jgi:hemerythrin-like metal-binding domain
MEYIKWLPDKYTVHVQKFDRQHQKLVEIINEIFNAKMNNAGNGVILNVLIQLNDYTKSHFMDEVTLLKENQYPDLETQKNEHALFITKVNGFIQEFHANNLSLNEEMLAFLKNWLINHIMQTDKRYGAFLNERGID